MQFGNLGFRGLLRAGRARYAHCFAWLNVGLHAGAGLRGRHRQEQSQPCATRLALEEPQFRRRSSDRSEGSEVDGVDDRRGSDRRCGHLQFVLGERSKLAIGFKRNYVVQAARCR